MYYEGFVDDYDNDLTGLNIRIGNNKIITNYLHKEHNIKFNKDELLEKIKKILPDNFKSWTLLQKNQFLEMKSLLSGYLLSSQGDRMSLAHSIEGRYPFLDHRIVEKTFYYKDSFKLYNLSQKYLLKKAFSNKIPESIINRPKLPYQAPDLKSFLRNGKPTENTEYFLSKEMLNKYGIFDEKFVARLLYKYKNKSREQVGYRDNMIITFLLSAQIAKFWIDNPQIHTLDMKRKNVEVSDYPAQTKYN
jgi:asparagine synthase (glutamine-hydrolysing)